MIKCNFSYFILCFFLFSLIGCRLKMPQDVLAEKKMENVLYDYHIAKAMGEELPYNERYKKAIYRESVYKKHNITQAEFDTSMMWYTRNLEVLSRVYEKVNKRLEREKESIDILVSIREDRPLISESGDSIDVWAWRKNYKLSSTPLHNKVTFVLPSDSNFFDRDTLIWQANYLLKGVPIVDSLFAFPIMSMQVVYDNDSTVYAINKIKLNGKSQLMVYADTLGSIKEVRGSIYIPHNDSLLCESFISDVTLMRYHAQDTLFMDSLEVDSIVAVDSIKEDEAKPKDEVEGIESVNIEIRRNPRALRERSKQEKKETESESKKEFIIKAVEKKKESFASIRLEATQE